MKKWRFLFLAVLSLILWCGVAVAGVFEHYEGIETHNGKVYALVNRDEALVYSPSQIAEYDKDLKELRRMTLEVGATAAKNSGELAQHNGKLYVGSSGSGDIWEVDIANWTARQVYVASNGSGISGLDIAPDGTVFLLAGGYDASWNFSASLFITTVARLSVGDAGTGMPITSSGGYSWGIAWSEYDQTLWLMAGMVLQARSKTGALIETFSPSQLGDNIYSIAPLEGGGLFYAVSNYANGSAGLITKSGSSYTVKSNLVTNLGGDVSSLAFKDSNERSYAVLCDTGVNFNSQNDVFYIYNPNNLSKPLINNGDWPAVTTHAIAALDNYLYIGTYGNYMALPGYIIKVDIGNILLPDVTPNLPADAKIEYDYDGVWKKATLPNGAVKLIDVPGGPTIDVPAETIIERNKMIYTITLSEDKKLTINASDGKTNVKASGIVKVGSDGTITLSKAGNKDVTIDAGKSTIILSNGIIYEDAQYLYVEVGQGGATISTTKVPNGYLVRVDSDGNIKIIDSNASSDSGSGCDSGVGAGALTLILVLWTIRKGKKQFYSNSI